LTRAQAARFMKTTGLILISVTLAGFTLAVLTAADKLL